MEKTGVSYMVCPCTDLICKYWKCVSALTCDTDVKRKKRTIRIRKKSTVKEINPKQRITTTSNPSIIGNQFSCFYCNKEINTYKSPKTKDHFVPKSKGGRKTVWSCLRCNQLKRDMMPQQWVYYVANNRDGHFTEKEIERIIIATQSLLIKL